MYFSPEELEKMIVRKWGKSGSIIFNTLLLLLVLASFIWIISFLYNKAYIPLSSLITRIDMETSWSLQSYILLLVGFLGVGAYFLLLFRHYKKEMKLKKEYQKAEKLLDEIEEMGKKHEAEWRKIIRNAIASATKPKEKRNAKDSSS